jgi:hypothetical protein
MYILYPASISFRKTICVKNGQFRFEFHNEVRARPTSDRQEPKLISPGRIKCIFPKNNFIQTYVFSSCGDKTCGLMLPS